MSDDIPRIHCPSGVCRVCNGEHIVGSHELKSGDLPDMVACCIRLPASPDTSAPDQVDFTIVRSADDTDDMADDGN